MNAQSFLISFLIVSSVYAAHPIHMVSRENRDTHQNAQDKSLEDCFDAALIRSETVGISEEQIKQAESVYHQAVGAVLPNLSGVGNYQIQKDPPANFSNFYPNPSTSTKVMVTQPLFQGFKEFAGLKQTKTLVEASEHDRKQAATQLYEDTAAAYFSVVSQENDIENIRDELAYYDKRIGELKSFVRIGRSQRTDVLTAESQKAALFAQMKQIEGQLRAQRAVLAFLTGWDSSTPLRDPADLEPKPHTLQEYLARLDLRPDVMGQKSRVSASEEGIAIARAGHWPTLSAQADYYLERTGPLKDVNWDAMLVLSVPLFEGGAVQAQVEQAASVRNQAELLVTKTRRAAEEQIRQFYESFEGDKNQYEAYTQATELSEKNYLEEVKNFRRGLVTNLDVLSALTTFQESKRSQDRAHYLMLLDYTNLEAGAAFRPTVKPKKKD